MKPEIPDWPHSDSPDCRCDTCESRNYAATEPFWQMDTDVALAIGAVKIPECPNFSRWELDGKDIGIVTTQFDYYPNSPMYGEGPCRKDWCPSVHLNDAFFAAEKFGLFKTCLLGISGGEWDICRWMPDGSRANKKPDYYHHAAGPTAAIAICEAILKLAKERQ